MAFKKGQSGNPSGRKKGLTPRGKFRQQVDDALPPIVDELVKSARAGDMAAAKMILDRCIPALKPTSDSATLKLKAGADLVARGEAIITAATSGELPIEQAKTLMDILSAQRAIVEQNEVVQRLESIEKWLHQTSAEQSDAPKLPQCRR